MSEDKMFSENLDYPKVLINQLERIGMSAGDERLFADNVRILQLMLTPYSDGVADKSPDELLKKLMKVMADKGLLLVRNYEEEI